MAEGSTILELRETSFNAAVSANAYIPTGFSTEGQNGNAKLGVAKIKSYVELAIHTALSGAAEARDLQEMESRIGNNEKEIKNLWEVLENIGDKGEPGTSGSGSGGGAPIPHNSPDTTYGVASADDFGHMRLSGAASMDGSKANTIGLEWVGGRSGSTPSTITPDLNEYINEGEYQLYNVSNASLNFPGDFNFSSTVSANSCRLRVIKLGYAAGTCFQMLYKRGNAPAVWQRCQNSGTWYDWVAVGSGGESVPNVSLTAPANTDTDTGTPAVASAPAGSVLQTIWNKIRSLANALANKQDKLTPGANITISGNTISASGASVAALSSQAAVFGQNARNGSATTAARSDHYHALPENIPGYNASVLFDPDCAAHNRGSFLNLTNTSSYSRNMTNKDIGRTYLFWTRYSDGSIIITIPSNSGTKIVTLSCGSHLRLTCVGADDGQGIFVGEFLTSSGWSRI